MVSKRVAWKYADHMAYDIYDMIQTAWLSRYLFFVHVDSRQRHGLLGSIEFMISLKTNFSKKNNMYYLKTTGTSRYFNLLT